MKRRAFLLGGVGLALAPVVRALAAPGVPLLSGQIGSIDGLILYDSAAPVAGGYFVPGIWAEKLLDQFWAESVLLKKIESPSDRQLLGATERVRVRLPKLDMEAL